ncbi:CMP-N-acetylneuraminic acid synthetase [Tenacibaculum sp. 190524A02b]|uniref:CMP-N-acetylneuraminic acid synthetase n=1 Tax=Tenacibaculum vairaonense TaxID=3137860 RepID=A0ABP1F679_9FLAO
MVKNKKIIGIIPARGGSKRIPKKNIIDFQGKPMIAWTIEAALKSGVFDEVMVSTDDVEISDVAKRYGASVPFLRKENADDHSTVSDVIVNVLKELKVDYDIVVMLMANCPLRNDLNIKESVNFFIDNDSSFQLSSFKFGWMNPWWAHTIEDDNRGKLLLSKNDITTRSQDLKDLYCITGAIWIADTKDILKSGTFYGENYTLKPIDWKNAIDIDDYEDLEMANVIYKL